MERMNRRAGWPFVERIGVLVSLLAAPLCAQQGDLPPAAREQRGSPLVTVSHANGRWSIAGRRNQVMINGSDLGLSVQAGPVSWELASSQADDMLVKANGEEFGLRLADAEKTTITEYDTGYKTGVKIRLERFRHSGLLNKGGELDLVLVLTVCLEGKAEDLVCDVVAIEHEAVVRRLDWPKEVDTRGADYSALNHVRGNLLPCDWPKPYHPYHNVPSPVRQERQEHDPEQPHRDLVHGVVGVSEGQVVPGRHRRDVG